MALTDKYASLIDLAKQVGADNLTIQDSGASLSIEGTVPSEADKQRLWDEYNRLDPDMRSFHPHITLGRCTGPACPGLNQWLQRHREFAGPPIRVDAFELYRSELNPGGAVHTLVERFDLKEAP